ncbi:MAG: hypothetical protein Q8P29_04640 [Candidatus Levybacteria bacterium]|nr:hypothetical protein [Candidatus Levybacteria bacterium]
MEFQSAKESNNIEPLHFSQKVAINSLPYIFEGDIPTSRKPAANFTSRWSVAVPNWQKQAEEIKELMRSKKMSHALPAELDLFEREKGSVGGINIDLRNNYIELVHIGTKTWIISTESKYHDANGVGSFLLKNFLTFADIKGLPTFLIPCPDGSSPLSNDATVDWYKRHGFQWIHDMSDKKDLPDGYGDMVRMPQEPDISQPITLILRNSKNNKALLTQEVNI